MLQYHNFFGLRMFIVAFRYANGKKIFFMPFVHRPQFMESCFRFHSSVSHE